MRLRLAFSDIPGRLLTGAFIVNAGLGKWSGSEEQAETIHTMAANAFPVLRPLPPKRFLRMLAVGELATGAVLLDPFISSALAGAALTGFSGALLTMYGRTPALHKPGSIRPTPAGTAISKDVWMLGIGLGLMANAWSRRRSSS
jgi:hypothetical protein